MTEPAKKQTAADKKKALADVEAATAAAEAAQATDTPTEDDEAKKSAKVNTSVSFDRAQLELLDEKAEERGVHRNNIIAMALEMALPRLRPPTTDSFFDLS